LPDGRVIKAVYQFNQLRAFSLTDIEIVEWAASIARLLPELNPSALEFMVDKMKIGEIQFDKTLGIQNIFNGLKQVTFENGEYKVLRLIW
jgi:hypothetical protein